MLMKYTIGFWDIGLIKMSVLAATLFLVSAWQGFADWVMATHWGWFLRACLLLAIRPMMAFFGK